MRTELREHHFEPVTSEKEEDISSDGKEESDEQETRDQNEQHADLEEKLDTNAMEVVLRMKSQQQYNQKLELQAPLLMKVQKKRKKKKKKKIKRRKRLRRARDCR